MPALTPEQEALKAAAVQFKLHGMFTPSHGRFNELANVDAILALFAQLEAAQAAPSLADFASAAELVCRAERVAAEETKAPEDAAYNQAIEHCIAAIRSLVPDTGIHAQTGTKESALQQPVQADTDKLLGIIYRTYQIAGAHDAPAHILDVLSDPEQATAEQVDAMLPYQPGPVQAVPDILFDGMAVYEEITRKLGKEHCISAEAVSATLDAVVRLIRAAKAAPGEPGQ